MTPPVNSKSGVHYHSRPQTIALVLVIFVGLAAAILLTRRMDAERQEPAFAEEQLYLKGTTAKRLSLAFNGLAADWYWMRSLQYVGRKVVHFQEMYGGQAGRVQPGDLAVLDLRNLAPLLRVATTLDPQFMAPYEYGAVILPGVDNAEAVALLHYGIEQNPNAWRLYQHLGYIYWQQHDYQKASETYAAGGRLPGAPRWLAEMSARMAAEGGSLGAAREMYQHLYDESNDEEVKQLLAKRLQQVDSMAEREVIRRVLNDYSKRSGRCASSWKDIASVLASLRFPVAATTAAPLDPSGMSYLLIKNGCDVDLNPRSSVPNR